MTSTEPKPKRKNAEFWRACRFLGPYRQLVLVSIVCAIFVGAISSGGLGLMLPILRVLVNGDTIQGWVDRQIVETRLGIKLLDNPEEARIIALEKESPARDQGMKIGDVLSSLGKFAQPQVSGFPDVSMKWQLGRSAAQHLPTHPVKVIAVLFGIILLLAVIANVVRFFQEYLSDKSAISAVNDIRKTLYDHVLHIPMSFFGLRGTSDVTSRLVQDSQNLQDGFKTILGQSIQEPAKAIFYFVLALMLSWKLTLVIILFAPLMGVVLKKLGKKMRRASRAALQRSSTMLGQIEGTLVGIRVVKSANAERFERRRYTGIMEELRGEQLKMARYEAWATPAMETLALLVSGIVLLVASRQVLITHSLDSSKFIVLMICIAGMGESLRRVSKVNNVLQRSNAAAARIFEILDMPVERVRGSGFRVQEKTTSASSPLNSEPGSTEFAEVRTLNPRIKIPPIAREIRFEDVSFTYAGANAPAVVDVSLSVAKGAAIAIVGRNGSGKTTLAALLPRFFDPQSGRITIDGIDIRNATLTSLRRQIGIVTQDSVLFPGTIAENIAYGHPLASTLSASSPVATKLRAEIEDAAKRAFAHDFIMEKTNGYDTTLDGLGGQLSGGQRQRLNIARAILRQAPILILDEATSQVDAESEHLIQQAIESLMHERTTFVIAHRFSTILSADTIVVLDRGKIVGQGKHEELLTTCPTYAQLYERQMFAAPVGVVR